MINFLGISYYYSTVEPVRQPRHLKVASTSKGISVNELRALFLVESCLEFPVKVDAVKWKYVYIRLWLIIFGLPASFVRFTFDKS